MHVVKKNIKIKKGLLLNIRPSAPFRLKMNFSVMDKKLNCTYSAQMRADQKKDNNKRDPPLNIIASLSNQFFLEK